MEEFLCVAGKKPKENMQIFYQFNHDGDLNRMIQNWAAFQYQF